MAQEISYDSEHFGISYLDKTGNEECFISKGNMFNIDTIYIDADTNEVFYDVSTTNLNQQVTFKIPRSDAYSTRMITNYSIKGLDVTDANKHIVVEVFRMLEKEGFPHEVGVILGYPVEDVIEFENHKGHDCKYCGCWKCYSDVEKARDCHCRFTECSRLCKQWYDEGYSINQIITKYQTLKTVA